MIETIRAHNYSDIIKLDSNRFRARKNQLDVFIKVETFENSSEVTALSELGKITGIPSLIEAFVTDKQQYIIMRYIEGETLDDLIESGSLDMAGKLDIILKIASMLRQIHDTGWIHGDLHCNNIIIDKNNIANIVDFGTSFKINQSTKNMPLYLPPESLIWTETSVRFSDNYQMDIKYDYWSLGLLAFRLFINEPIPSASNFMLGAENVTTIRGCYQLYVEHQIPQQINILLRGCLEQNPQSRTIIL